MAQKILDIRNRPTRLAPKEPQAPRSTRKDRAPEKRIPLRARRRRARILIALLAVTLLALCIYGVHWLSYRPEFSITTVEVTGAEDAPVAEIQSFAHHLMYEGPRTYISHANILNIPKAEIEQHLLSEMPLLKNVTISHPSLMSHVIVVTITERQLFSEWCDSACYEVDEDGFIFDHAHGTSTAQYTFTGGLPESSTTVATSSPIGRSFVQAFIPSLIGFLDSIKRAGVYPTGARIESTDDFTIHLTEGFTVKGSFNEDPETLTDNLQLLLGTDPLKGMQDQIEYIDLRFGNRVYYKLKGEEQATVTH